jgi:Secretion system C-terminal sorting domain
MQSYNLSFLGKACLALCIGLILSCATNAQCVNNLATMTYDTALNSKGFGDFNLRFPQFNPDSGTLVSVRLIATVNSMYGFTLRNADSLNTTYALMVGQQDQITGTTIPATYSNITSQSMGTYPLNPGQSVTQASLNVLSNHISTDTITAVSSFLGAGQVSLNYQSFTFTNLSTVNNAAYYYSAGITNSMTFSVQYLYCRGGSILASDLTNWSAAPDGPRTIQLNWAATNESAGRQYVIQRSTDSRNYTNIATLPASSNGSTADYNYPDELPANPDSNWYYRLQILEKGQIYYSDVKLVTLASEGKGIQLYPNPVTNYINLVPDQQTASDWQVDILAANGNLVQRNTFMQTRLMQVDFRQKLSAGTYFVRATDLRGQRFYSASFLVTGSH